MANGQWQIANPIKGRGPNGTLRSNNQANSKLQKIFLWCGLQVGKILDRVDSHYIPYVRCLLVV
jgi:hypothetical protein